MRVVVSCRDVARHAGAAMEQVIVAAKVENLEDLYEVHNGRLAADKVRTLDVTDAVVDSGATGLMIPTRLLPQLGLRSARQRRGRLAGRESLLRMHEAVRLTVQGRECKVEVYEIADPNPVVIGLVPLGALDLVIDARNSKLIGNPEHGGEHVIEAISAWL